MKDSLLQVYVESFLSHDLDQCLTLITLHLSQSCDSQQPLGISPVGRSRRGKEATLPVTLGNVPQECEVPYNQISVTLENVPSGMCGVPHNQSRSLITHADNLSAQTQVPCNQSRSLITHMLRSVVAQSKWPTPNLQVLESPGSCTL